MAQSQEGQGAWNTVRGVVDVLSSIALIVAAGAFVWSIYARGTSASPAGNVIPPPEAPVSIEGAARMGSDAASVVMIAFSDFECPFCSRFSKDTQPVLVKDYVESGKVQLVFRHLPLPMHGRATAAAIAAECAGAQDKFWPMHDRLFQDPKKLADEDLAAHAAAAGLDADVFAQCVKTEAVAKRVAADAEFANSIGIAGTPAFLVGRRAGDGKVAVGEVISGARPAADFKKALDKLLEG